MASDAETVINSVILNKKKKIKDDTSNLVGMTFLPLYELIDQLPDKSDLKREAVDLAIQLTDQLTESRSWHATQDLIKRFEKFCVEQESTP